MRYRTCRSSELTGYNLVEVTFVVDIGGWIFNFILNYCSCACRWNFKGCFIFLSCGGISSDVALCLILWMKYSLSCPIIENIKFGQSLNNHGERCKKPSDIRDTLCGIILAHNTAHIAQFGVSSLGGTC